MDSPTHVPSWDRWLQRFWFLFFALWALFSSLVITANFRDAAPARQGRAPARHRPVPIATPHPVRRSPATWQAAG